MAKLSNREAANLEEAVHLLQVGSARRRYSSMPLNPVSSRSHCILRVRLHKTYESGATSRCTMCFADLMGSEALVEGPPPAAGLGDPPSP